VPVNPRVAVYGANGRMGRMVTAEVVAAGLPLVAAISARADGRDAGDLAGIGPIGVVTRAPSAEALEHADVVIDFSSPQGLSQLIPLLGGRALVSGTTGLAAADFDRLADCANVGPVLWAANFSTGVTVLLDLAARAARALPAYDVEIVEMHHNQKRDAPSGTALALGRAIAAARGHSLADHAKHGREGLSDPRPSGEIGFHALRGGDVVGDHQIWLAGPGERVLLGHVATSRRTFAAGAVHAARRLAGRAPGRYELAALLGLTEDR
jgi:4-hydroxy-tetrahydrodipicolinate reductase